MVKVLLLLLLSAFIKRTFADATNALVMSIPHHKPVGDSELHCDFFYAGEIFDYLIKNGRMKESDVRAKFRQVLCS